jgi:AraC-like DNA-binding protein
MIVSNTSKWLERLDVILEKRLAIDSLNNKELAMAMEISERQFFRKVKELSELSPQKYLNKFRLEKAHNYLRKGEFRTVKEVAYAVGFKNVSYFIRQFEKEYGLTPFNVLKDAGWR